MRAYTRISALRSGPTTCVGRARQPSVTTMRTPHRRRLTVPLRGPASRDARALALLRWPAGRHGPDDAAVRTPAHRRGDRPGQHLHPGAQAGRGPHDARTQSATARQGRVRRCPGGRARRPRAARGIDPGGKRGARSVRNRSGRRPKPRSKPASGPTNSRNCIPCSPSCATPPNRDKLDRTARPATGTDRRCRYPFPLPCLPRSQRRRRHLCHPSRGAHGARPIGVGARSSRPARSSAWPWASAISWASTCRP